MRAAHSARGREAARALRIDASRYEAAFLAQEARVGVVAPFDTEQQWRFLIDQAGERSKQGDEFGDNPALIEAIDVYTRCLALAPRPERPLEWARTQKDLGNALAALGARESGTARLEEAVAVFREALQEYTRDRVPLDWAATQNNLGNALAALGERESGTARLEEAVAAYREALQERTRARVPLDWAMTQNNLGLALLVSASGRAGRRGSKRPSPPIARPCWRMRPRARAPLRLGHDPAQSRQGLSRALRQDRRAAPP